MATYAYTPIHLGKTSGGKTERPLALCGKNKATAFFHSATNTLHQITKINNHYFRKVCRDCLKELEHLANIEALEQEDIL